MTQFHGGALSASRRAAEDGYQAAFGQYQQTVSTAFQQVADYLRGFRNASDAVTTQEHDLGSADSALRLTRMGYSAGTFWRWAGGGWRTGGDPGYHIPDVEEPAQTTNDAEKLIREERCT